MSRNLRGIRQIRQQKNALRWWFDRLQEHPLGLVPRRTAARILDVPPSRVAELVREGRLTCIEGMPGGAIFDQFIPVAELIDAPFLLDTGRPGVHGPRISRQSQKS